MIGQPVLSGEGCRVTGTGWDPYIYAGALYHPLYVVAYFADGSTDGSTKFNDVTVTYRRQVSPAPPTATFSDVPTTDFGFQHVEALAASAITGGCGNGKYCPDAPVTRRQMAIFLAKALGLVWPQ